MKYVKYLIWALCFGVVFSAIAGAKTAAPEGKMIVAVDLNQVYKTSKLGLVSQAKIEEARALLQQEATKRNEALNPHDPHRYAQKKLEYDRFIEDANKQLSDIIAEETKNLKKEVNKALTEYMDLRGYQIVLGLESTVYVVVKPKYNITPQFIEFLDSRK